MPRKSYRQIALDELQNKCNGLRSSIFNKYAIDSDSESDSDDDGDPPDLVPRDVSGYDSDDSSIGGKDRAREDNSGYDAGSDINSDDSDDDLEEMMFLKTKEELDKVLNSRYYTPRKKYRTCDDTVFKKHLDESEGCFLKDDEFKQQYRCARDAMDWICDQIKDETTYDSI